MMQIFLGDSVVASREIGGDMTVVTGRIQGLVQKDNGDLKYFYIRGIDTALWMSDGWQFDEPFTIEDEDEE